MRRGGREAALLDVRDRVVPANVAWHKMPSKHDMGGAGHAPERAFPKAIPDGKKSKGKSATGAASEKKRSSMIELGDG